MLSMVGAVDDYVGLLHEQRPADGKLHPSFVWGCTRRAVYTLRGVEPTDPHSARTRRRFRLGTMVHQLVTDALSLSPDVAQCFVEFEIRGERDAGHGDVLLELEDGTWVVVEIKTVRSPKPAVDARHLGQTCHYAVRARTTGVWVDEGDRFIAPLGDRLAGVVLLYVGRESADVAEFFFPYEEAWEGTLDARLNELDAYAQDSYALPPRLVDARSTRSRACYGCPYATRCWKEDGAGVVPDAPRTTPGQAESGALSARHSDVPSNEAGSNGLTVRRPDPVGAERQEVRTLRD
jgi:hypothetical protein